MMVSQLSLHNLIQMAALIDQQVTNITDLMFQIILRLWARATNSVSIEESR